MKNALQLGWQRGWRYVLFAVAAYLIFLLASFPAAHAYRLLAPRLPSVHLYAITGTVWSGHAAMATVNGKRYEQFSWTLHPWALLLGHLEATAASQGPLGEEHGVIGRTWGGDVYLRDTLLRLSPDRLESFLNLPGVKFAGELYLELQRADFAAGKLQAAEGRGVWAKAKIVDTDIPLGQYTLTFTSQNGTLKGILRDEPGSVFRAEGALTINPAGNYRFSGGLTLRNPGQPDIERVLRYFGAPGPAGKVPLSAQGRLPEIG